MNDSNIKWCSLSGAGHLSPKHLKIIADILHGFKGKITKTALFGSRATGTYKTISDIDLVLYGSLDISDIDRLHTLFEESLLPMKVDVKAYNLVNYPPLKAHIDAVSRPLF